MTGNRKVFPITEAVQLSALIAHAQSCLDSMNGNAIRRGHLVNDPYVLIKINGKWHPVRGNVVATGEHRNAVCLTYLEEEIQ